MQLRVDHAQASSNGVHSFDGFNYVLMTEGDQGFTYPTRQSRGLNQVVVDTSEIFRLVGLYPLPGDNCARLYFVRRTQ